MKYLIKQKVFSLNSSFTIKNELEEDCFQVEGKVFSLGKKLALNDMLGNEIFFIEQKLMKLMPEYHLKRNGETVAIITKKLSFLKAKFEISSSIGHFYIEGSPLGYNYTIIEDNQIIATISKQFFALSDTYGVEVNENQDSAFIIGLIIVIDQVMNEGNN